MSEQVTVAISKPLFERLQRLAAPLVDTTDTVIERLLDFWETRPTKKAAPANSPSTATPALWK